MLRYRICLASSLGIPTADLIIYLIFNLVHFLFQGLQVGNYTNDWGQEM
jgi:hypothetical protein